MALTFFIDDRSDILRLGFGEKNGGRQWFGAHAAEFVAAAVDDGIAVGATAFGFGFDAAREDRRIVQIDVVQFQIL